MTLSESPWAKKDDNTLKEELSRLQYEVTQHGATEPPFQNPFWDQEKEGLYVDITSGEPLFSSRDKFKSGTGWPSFVRPISKEHVEEHIDQSHGMRRVEVKSRIAKAHLGHVFKDGPKEEGGLRYCMNSASMRFIPLADMEKEGYGAYIPLVRGKSSSGTAQDEGEKPLPLANCESSFETATLAGGCFWGMEEILRDIPGVISTEVGYTGGQSLAPSYRTVSQGNTGHAEAVRILFDPTVLSFESLLRDWFFKMHDPTTPNQQGNDIGSQYRSIVFFASEKQKEIALSVIQDPELQAFWKKPIVTEILEESHWQKAEEEHQDYLQKHPGGYSCHWLRKP